MYNIVADSENAALTIHFGHHYLISSALATRTSDDWSFTLITASFPMPFDNPAATIKSLEMNNAALQKKLDEFTHGRALADSEIENLNRQLNEHKTQLERLQQNVVALSEKNEQIMLDLEKRNSEIALAHKEKENLLTKLRALEEDYDDCRKAFAQSSGRFQEQLDQKQTEVNTLKEMTNDLARKITEKQLALQELNQLKQELDANILEKNMVISELNNKIVELSALNKQYLDEINKLQQVSNSDNEATSAGHKPVSLGNVYKNIVENIDSFEQSNNTGYKLSGLHVKLKGVVAADQGNFNIRFLESSGAKDIPIEAISEIEFKIESQGRIETPASGTMPNVLNLTETAVRRILSSMNLTLYPVYKVNRAVPHGLSFKQVPEPGMPVNSQQSVTVVFSRNE